MASRRNRSVAMPKAMAALLTSLFTIVLVIVVLLTNTAGRTPTTSTAAAAQAAAAEEEDEAAAGPSGLQAAAAEEEREEQAVQAVQAGLGASDLGLGAALVLAVEAPAHRKPLRPAANVSGGAPIPGVRVFGDCGAAELRDAPGSLSDDVPSAYPSTRPWSDYRRRLKATYLASRAAGWELTIDSALRGLLPSGASVPDRDEEAGPTGC